MNDERAVSEVVGYVLILGVVFTSIGIVYVNGVPVLQDAEETEHLNNAERSFSVLQNNMDLLVENNVPRRATQMRLTDGNLEIDTGLTQSGRSPGLIINVTNSTGDLIYTDRGYVAPVEYGINDRSVVYENGAVLRSNEGTTGMIYEPGWKLREDRLMINSIRTVYGGGTLGVNERVGSSTALIRAEYTGVNEVGNVRDCSGGCEVNVTAISDHSTAWGQYFNASFSDDPDVDVNRLSDESVSMEIDGVRRVLYTRTNVELGIQ